MKKEFLSTASHELLDGLNSIHSSVEIVADGTLGELNDRQKNFLDRSMSAIRKLGTLMRDLSEYQKLEADLIPFKTERVGLNDLVAQAVKRFEPEAAAKGLTLACEMAEESFVNADGAKISSVLDRLLRNAIAFGKNSVTIRKIEQKGLVGVSIRDKGCGIHPDNLPKLFHPFPKIGDKTHGGSGLGLSLSRLIVEKMGGRTGIESVEGEGTTVYFLLPKT